MSLVRKNAIIGRGDATAADATTGWAMTLWRHRGRARGVVHRARRLLNSRRRRRISADLSIPQVADINDLLGAQCLILHASCLLDRPPHAAVTASQALTSSTQLMAWHHDRVLGDIERADGEPGAPAGTGCWSVCQDQCTAWEETPTSSDDF